MNHRATRASAAFTTNATLVGSLLLAVSAVGASPQSIRLQQQLQELAGYYALPATSIQDRIKDRFAHLARQWRRQTRFLSSTSDLATHPAYQAIIGMGQEVLPLILANLREHPAHWFWALRAISNEDPVPPRDRGVVKRMTDAWLRWGAAKGYLTT